MADVLKTSSMMTGHVMVFNGDDAIYEKECVIEVVDNGGELEIAWDEDKIRRYLRFRMPDLRRAIKEFGGRE